MVSTKLRPWKPQPVYENKGDDHYVRVRRKRHTLRTDSHGRCIVSMKVAFREKRSWSNQATKSDRSLTAWIRYRCSPAFIRDIQNKEEK